MLSTSHHREKTAAEPEIKNKQRRRESRVEKRSGIENRNTRETASCSLYQLLYCMCCYVFVPG